MNYLPIKSTKYSIKLRKQRLKLHKNSLFLSPLFLLLFGLGGKKRRWGGEKEENSNPAYDPKKLHV